MLLIIKTKLAQSQRQNSVTRAICQDKDFQAYNGSIIALTCAGFVEEDDLGSPDDRDRHGELALVTAAELAGLSGRSGG